MQGGEPIISDTVVLFTETRFGGKPTRRGRTVCSIPLLAKCSAGL